MKRTLYRLHVITSSLRIVGDAIEYVALPWSLLNATGSLISIGGFSLFTHLPWVLFPPILGRALDRATKKVRLAFLALILQALLAVLIVPLSSNVWAFYLIVSGISALDILHRYYGLSLIASMTLDSSELQSLNAKLATVENALSLVAFPLAGFLTYRFGIRAMLLDAVLLLLGALALVPYLNVEVKREGTEEAREEKRLQISRRLVVGVLASVLLFNFALGSFRIFVFASLKELAKGEVLYGLLQGLTTVGSLVAVAGLTYLARKRLAGLKRPLILGMLLQSIALLIVGVPAVVALFPAVFILGFGGELLNVSFDSLMQRFIPLESLGTARGVFDALATIVIPLSHLVFAWLIERGVETLCLTSAAFLIGALAVGLFAITTRGLPSG
ncbi:MFS transporter [Thermococcus gammatolerans]|uniref:Permease, major facilitator superfamily n=1 Tax=Thermococcus gammatolerans (strain DSM 15229 / JCM 11827 / EJ3) TaxID=593117 RepID=C5A772_THEGJ|nr:MFS transporter [Thermococcus gammatolerans]ACS34084.1 Permease, major facilitator superfamily [Thermococcus gammatolerans EJ3]